MSVTQTMSVKKNSIKSVTILDRTVLFGMFCNLVLWFSFSNASNLFGVLVLYLGTTIRTE